LPSLQFVIRTLSPFNSYLSSRDRISLSLESECHDHTILQNDDPTPVLPMPETVQKRGKFSDVISGDAIHFQSSEESSSVQLSTCQYFSLIIRVQAKTRGSSSNTRLAPIRYRNFPSALHLVNDPARRSKITEKSRYSPGMLPRPRTFQQI
jgi:hypothetical protein